MCTLVINNCFKILLDGYCHVPKKMGLMIPLPSMMVSVLAASIINIWFILPLFKTTIVSHMLYFTSEDHGSIAKVDKQGTLYKLHVLYGYGIN